MRIEHVEIDEESLLDDPSINYWLKDAIRAMRRRDPVDALADAEILLKVCEQRHERVLRGTNRVKH